MLRIRILLFSSVTFKVNKNVLSKFFCLILSEGTFTSFFKDKKSFRSHKTVGIIILLLFCLIIEGSGSVYRTNGSGSGSGRPKNIRILRIRIRNTALYYTYFVSRQRKYISVLGLVGLIERLFVLCRPSRWSWRWRGWSTPSSSPRYRRRRRRAASSGWRVRRPHHPAQRTLATCPKSSKQCCGSLGGFICF